MTSDERGQLEGTINLGRESAHRRRYAQVLMLVDQGEHGSGLFDKDVAERTGFTRRTVEKIHERCVTEGLDAVFERKKRSRDRSRKLDGDGEARLIIVACSGAPR